MPSTMPTIETTLGAWMISSWVSALLWSVEAVFCWRYFAKYRRDHWAIRSGVAVCFLAGTATVIASCSGVYRVAVGSFGNVLKALYPTVEMSITPLMSGISALIGQTYLIWRYKKVSKQRVLALLFEILAIVAFGLCIFGFVCLIKLAHGEKDVAYLRHAPTIVYSLTAAVDVLVSGALIVFLWRLRDTEMASTQKLLARLILVAFESGSITSALAISTLLAFTLSSRSQICVSFAAATGYSQSLCLLYNLNMRRIDNEPGTWHGASSFPLSKIKTGHFVRSGTHMHGVTIHQETVMHEDDDRAISVEADEKKMPFVPQMHVSYAA